MTRAERIEAEFPPGITMPPELRMLCDYLDRTGYPLSGHHKLRPEGAALRAWFGGDSEATRQLAGFGAGADGSTLALWLYAGPDASKAPVVHLGSEGDALMVLANDFREFLHLLGIGYGEIGFEDLDAPPQEPESAERLRGWLASEFGIVPPETGGALVRAAKARHPDFAAWVQESVRRREAGDAAH